MQSKKPERKPCETSHLHLVTDENEAGVVLFEQTQLVESSASSRDSGERQESVESSTSSDEQRESVASSASSPQQQELVQSSASDQVTQQQESVESSASSRNSDELTEQQKPVENAQTPTDSKSIAPEEASETTQPAEPSPLASSYRRNGKIDHAQILGDPFASEKTWMAAHIASDRKCKPASPSPLKKAIFAVLTAIGVCWSLMTVWLATLLGLFFVDNAQAYSLGSLDLYQFGSLNGTIAVACLCSFISSLALWSAFLLKPGRVKKIINILVGTATTLIVALLCYCVGWISAPVLLGMFVASVLGSYLLGSICQTSLPKSLSIGKLLRGNALTLLFPASFFIATMCGVVQSLKDHPLSTSPSLPSGTQEQMFGMILTQVAFAFCVLTPGFGMALFAKSKSAAASVLMSVVTQAPIIFGFLIATVFSVIAATGLDHSIVPEISGLTINGIDWARFGWARTALLLGMTLWTILLAVGGGWLGTKLVRK